MTGHKEVGRLSKSQCARFLFRVQVFGLGREFKRLTGKSLMFVVLHWYFVLRFRGGGLRVKEFRVEPLGSVISVLDCLCSQRCRCL